MLGKKVNINYRMKTYPMIFFFLFEGVLKGFKSVSMNVVRMKMEH